MPANPYMRGGIITLILHSLTVGCRVGCGVCCAREDAGDGLQCAGRPGGHVRALRRDAADQVVHAGLQHICMQVGWLGDGRLARLVGRFGCSGSSPNILLRRRWCQTVEKSASGKRCHAMARWLLVFAAVTRKQAYYLFAIRHGGR
jgi:hypothetical protein